MTAPITHDPFLARRYKESSIIYKRCAQILMVLRALQYLTIAQMIAKD